VATLQDGSLEGFANDAADWSPAVENGNGRQSPKTARVSADGGAVVFSSRRALSGAENRAKQCSNGGVKLEPCAEFFRYSVATDALDCISCDPTGVQPLGNATIGTPFIDVEDLPNTFPAPAIPKNLSADGNRFFFQTPDPLVAADVNAKSGCKFGEEEDRAACMDVYEWEAAGEGTCGRAGGCVQLISGGRDPEPSYFLDADESGSEAFFLTAGSLDPHDPGSYDVYVARENGGFPVLEEPVPCVADACQILPEAPEDPTPGTLVPSTGNPALKVEGAPGKPKKGHKQKKGHRRHPHKRAGTAGGRK